MTHNHSVLINSWLQTVAPEEDATTSLAEDMCSHVSQRDTVSQDNLIQEDAMSQDQDHNLSAPYLNTITNLPDPSPAGTKSQHSQDVIITSNQDVITAEHLSQSDANKFLTQQLIVRSASLDMTSNASVSRTDMKDHSNATIKNQTLANISSQKEHTAHPHPPTTDALLTLVTLVITVARELTDQLMSVHHAKHVEELGASTA